MTKQDKCINNLSNDDLIKIGFERVRGFTVGSTVRYPLGRGRFISATCIGVGNEAIFICEQSKIGNHYTDLVCIHNRDYDGVLTIEKLQKIIDAFEVKNDRTR